MPIFLCPYFYANIFMPIIKVQKSDLPIILNLVNEILINLLASLDNGEVTMSIPILLALHILGRERVVKAHFLHFLSITVNFCHLFDSIV